MAHDSVISTPIVGFDARPFHAVRFAYGMMLGDSDLNGGFDNARGQQQVASAWQHGGGVLWGYEVTRDLEAGEIAIGPGLAVDGVGRFVSNRHERQCISVGKWYAAEGRVMLGMSESVTAPTFDLLVVARYATCSTAPVPVVSATCSTSAGPSDVVDSRLSEQAKLYLIPDTPQPSSPRFPRLRLLAGLPGNEAGAAIDVQPREIPPSVEASLDQFRAVAAEDSAKMRPAALPDSSRGFSDFPERDDGYVVLARVAGIRLVSRPSGWKMVTGRVDHSARRAMIDTGTLQELLGVLLADVRVHNGGAVDDRVSGPKIIRRSVRFGEHEVVVRTDGWVRADTFTARAISLTALDDDGWRQVQIGEPDVVSDELTIPFVSVPDARWYRLIIRGRGRGPVMGTGPEGVFAPLAGGDDDSHASRHQGVDFVHMQEC